MSTTIQEQLQILEETKAQIKQALIDKNQAVLDTDSFQSYATKIENIPTLTQATSDATAIADDMALGKTAYVKGELIVGQAYDHRGNKPTDIDTNKNIYSLDEANSWIGLTAYVDYYNNSVIINNETPLFCYLRFAKLAEVLGLTPDMIVEGNTILGIAGTGKTSEDLQDIIDEQDELIAAQAVQIEELKSLVADKASNFTTETIDTVNEILGNEEV